jgi:hypothetical protein
MKAGIFMLTKSEQRVVILVVLALLTAAFIRYWRDDVSEQQLESPENSATATPLSSPEDTQLNLEESADNNADEPRPLPSPQSFP